MCVRQDVEGRLRGEYMTAALLLTLVVSTIDAVTVAHGRIGVLEDSGVALGEAGTTRPTNRTAPSRPFQLSRTRHNSGARTAPTEASASAATRYSAAPVLCRGCSIG
jgi:hypothetical protein